MVEILVKQVESFIKKNGKEVKIDEYEEEEKENYKIRFLTHIKDKRYSEASECLVEYINNLLKIYTTKDDNRSEMWVYKNGIYIPHGRAEVREKLRQLLGSSFSMFYYNQVIAKLEADTYIEPDEFFKINYEYLVPVQNGILNLKTRELSQFDVDKVFFSKLPIKYEKKASCPRIEEFLSNVLASEDDIKIIYEIGGFALINEYLFEKAFMFLGNGRNGKDKTLELFKRLIGIENCSSLSLNSLVPESFSISELFGKKLNLAGEISSSDLKDTSMFKALTGRSVISANRKFLTGLKFVNYSKFVFACNELPVVYDLSMGFWDRWILIEFPFTFVTKEEYEKTKDKKRLKIRDEEIISKITTPEELSGLLNKFLDGLDRLLKNRKFSSSKSLEEVKNLWIRKSNSFIAFCIDNVEEDGEGRIKKKDLRKKYAEYCKFHKVLPKSDVVIKKVLQEAPYGASEQEVKEALLGYQTERYWLGVKWKN